MEHFDPYRLGRVAEKKNGQGQIVTLQKPFVKVAQFLRIGRKTPSFCFLFVCQFSVDGPNIKMALDISEKQVFVK